MSTTKSTSFRIGQQAIDRLNYLCILYRKSAATLISEMIAERVDTIHQLAEQANPSLKNAPQYLMNGGTVISVEEQQAMQKIRETLTQLGR